MGSFFLSVKKFSLHVNFIIKETYYRLLFLSGKKYFPLHKNFINTKIKVCIGTY